MKRLILLLMIMFVTGGVEAQAVKVITCGKLLDVVREKMLKNAEIVIKDNVITAVGTDLTYPANSEIIDLSHMTVLPGLIDGHVHICIDEEFLSREPILYESIPYRTIKAADAAKKNLEAGFTALRDVGNEGAFLTDIAVRDAINEGIIIGPRLQVSSFALTITGGYEDIRGYNPQLNLPPLGVLTDSKEEMVKEIRKQVKFGTDLIKIYATGSVSDISRETFEPLSQLELDEVKAMVKEAKRWGRFVAAHAYGGEGAKNAILGGVRSIEHGILLKREHIDLMKEHDVFWCPTLKVYKSLENLTNDKKVYEYLLENHKKIFKYGIEQGIKIAFGTDTGAIPHGKNAEEFGTMVEYGMTPMQAIRSATIVAAELMGWDEEIGSIEKGKYADVIAVEGNPLNNIGILTNVKFVMKDGIVIKKVE